MDESLMGIVPTLERIAAALELQNKLTTWLVAATITQAQMMGIPNDWKTMEVREQVESIHELMLPVVQGRP